MPKIFATFLFFIVCLDYGQLQISILKGTVPKKSSCGFLDIFNPEKKDGIFKVDIRYYFNGKKTVKNMYILGETGTGYFNIVTQNGTHTGKIFNMTASGDYRKKGYIIKYVIKKRNKVESVYCGSAMVNVSTPMEKTLKSFCNEPGTLKLEPCKNPSAIKSLFDDDT